MKDDYSAYLLRLQRGQTAVHWRATLENAHTGEVHHFATETELLRHLLVSLTSAPNPEQSSQNKPLQGGNNGTTE